MGSKNVLSYFCLIYKLLIHVRVNPLQQLELFGLTGNCPSCRFHIVHYF